MKDCRSKTILDVAINIKDIKDRDITVEINTNIL